jgi:hypothetical protein
LKYRFRRFVSTPEVWIEDLIAASQAWGQLRVHQTEVKQQGHAKEVGKEMI